MLLLLLIPTSSATNNKALQASKDLRVNFYQESCPQAEDIVAKVVISSFRNDPAIAAGLIRLAFHDCFVNGCDASILLEKTPTGEKTERDSPINGQNMRGLSVIDQAKKMIEEECPGIVSCADIIQFAARDSVIMTGLYHYDVPGGRRDGLVSREKDIEANMPLVVWNVTKMVEIFNEKGLNNEDLVVLMGAHSVGSAHCPTFYYRAQKNDPKLSSKMSEKMKAACNKPNFQDMLNSSLPFDSVSPNLLDTGFYNQLISGEALIESDQALSLDSRTSKIVYMMASPNGRWRDEKFVNAMVKMGNIEVKTGTEGEIRKHSQYVNEPSGSNADSGSDAYSGSDPDNDSTPDINMGPFGNLFPGLIPGIPH